MPTEILPYLWIGDYKDSMNIEFLHDKKIKVIINCTKDIDFFDDPEFINIKKIRIPVDDRPSVSYVEDNTTMYYNIYEIIISKPDLCHHLFLFFLFRQLF